MCIQIAAAYCKIKVGDTPNAWVCLRPLLETIAVATNISISLYLSHRYEPVSVCLFAPKTGQQCLDTMNPGIFYILVANMFFYIYIIAAVLFIAVWSLTSTCVKDKVSDVRKQQMDFLEWVHERLEWTCSIGTSVFILTCCCFW